MSIVVDAPRNVNAEGIETSLAGRAPRLGAEAYIPFPFDSRNQVVLQVLQVFAPIVGLIAACVHTFYFGHALGTFMMIALLGTFAGLGVTMGFHRMLTHRSFEARPWVRNLLAIFGSMAGQHSLFLWVATHRKHHHFSDQAGDPHSPNTLDAKLESHGSAFFRSHITSVLTGRLTDADLRYIPDLASDVALCRIQRLYVLWILIGLAIPALLCYAINGTLHAAIGGLLWGGFARMFVTTQTTYAVNSICHLWGRRPFESHDSSRNNRAVALLSMGEGWHNNHHAFPTSARHGLLRGQFDLTWSAIQFLRRCGLVWNVKTPTPEQMQAKSRA